VKVVQVDYNTYFYLVTVAALIYTLAIRFIQKKVMNKALMDEVQANTKRINELTKEVSKGDKRKSEELEKLNNDMMPKMNQLMMEQMKMMVVLLAVFFAFTIPINMLDPTHADDYSFNMTKSGAAWSGTAPIHGADGFWYATATAYSQENSELGSTQEAFFVGSKSGQIVWIRASGAAMNVTSDSEVYAQGANATFYANVSGAEPARVTVLLNGGTRFFYDLPVEIPILNLKRIYEAQSWFIFIAFIFGLVSNPLVSWIEKQGFVASAGGAAVIKAEEKK
jgi:hypothetical protein